MVSFGVNLNNREPLLTERFGVAEMVDLAGMAEERGFESVWVGDSLLERPRLEPLTCLAAVASRTESVSLGTACLITPLWNPVKLAHAWITLDMLSNGRTVLGACMDRTTEKGRKQYEVVGVDPDRHVTVFEEGLAVLRSLFDDGEVTYSGSYFEFDDVRLSTDAEAIPLEPVQDRVPIIVVSNPSLHGNDPVVDRAIERIVDLGDGWMTASRAHHPEEYAAQQAAIESRAVECGRDPAGVESIYQVTVHVDESPERAQRNMTEYVGQFYPDAHVGDGVDRYTTRGPAGDADAIIEWLQEFADLGCETFVLRFAAEDQVEQLERFTTQVMPSFET